MSKYTVEKGCGSLTLIHVTEPNEKGETLLIELSECENPGGKNALPVLWKKHGFIDRVLDTYICINTYVTDSEGNCYGRYNPQTKLSDDGKRNVINFDWMFENTEENKQKAIRRAERKARKRAEAIYYIKQKLSGVVFAAIGIITPIICNGDATFSLIALPLGIWLIFTKEKVMMF